MSTTFQPLGDRILIKVEEKTEEVRSSGIIIPDNAKDKPQEGLVVAIGKGRMGKNNQLLPMDVSVGDKILFGKYSGTEIKLDGQQYLLMHQEDVLGVIGE